MKGFMMAMEKDIKYILMDGKEIESTVARIASEIDRDYRNSNKKLLLLCILKGSVVFMGELMKKISLPVEIDFMKVSSYEYRAVLLKCKDPRHGSM